MSELADAAREMLAALRWSRQSDATTARRRRDVDRARVSKAARLRAAEERLRDALEDHDG